LEGVDKGAMLRKLVDAALKEYRIKSVIEHKISKEEALDALDKLAKVMWLRIDVYEDARNTIKEL